MAFTVAMLLGCTQAMALSRNVALGATATANMANEPASYVTDGNLATRWASGFPEAGQTPTLTIDLGSEVSQINKIEIVWEGAWGKSYDVLAAGADNEFTTIFQVENDDLTGQTFPYTKELTLSEPITARYVRLVCREAGTQWAFSVWEFRVLSDEVDLTGNIATYGTASAGINNETAYLSNDGDLGTRWGSSADGKDDFDKQWYEIDLGEAYDLTSVVIFWEGAYSTNYQILSRVTDADEWTTLATVNSDIQVGNAEENANAVTLDNVSARYVRIKSTANSLDNAYGMSIWEVRIFASAKSSEPVEPKPEPSPEPEPVNPDPTALANLNASECTVTSGCGYVSVVAPEGQRTDVFTLTGRRAATLIGTQRVSLGSGIYVVRTAGGATKLRVN